MLSRSSLAILRKATRARTLLAISAHPGVPQKDLSAVSRIKESNLSVYVRDLANAGLVEPTPASKNGKAWKLSPWGVQTLFQATEVLSPSVSPEVLTKALQGAIELRGAAVPVPSGELAAMIPKDEVYRRLELALNTTGAEPLRVTTFYGGDLRQHDRAWDLHEKYVTKPKRPVHWILHRDHRTKEWTDVLIQKADGNPLVSIFALGKIDEPGPSVQVLDDAGLLYPLGPAERGLISSRDEALVGWESYRDRAEPALVNGARE
jgi:hypothetical protein